MQGRACRGCASGDEKHAVWCDIFHYCTVLSCTSRECSARLCASQEYQLYTLLLLVPQFVTVGHGKGKRLRKRQRFVDPSPEKLAGLRCSEEQAKAYSTVTYGRLESESETRHATRVRRGLLSDPAPGTKVHIYFLHVRAALSDLKISSLIFPLQEKKL